MRYDKYMAAHPNTMTYARFALGVLVRIFIVCVLVQPMFPAS